MTSFFEKIHKIINILTSPVFYDWHFKFQNSNSLIIFTIIEIYLHMFWVVVIKVLTWGHTHTHTISLIENSHKWMHNTSFFALYPIYSETTDK